MPISIQELRTNYPKYITAKEAAETILKQKYFDETIVFQDILNREVKVTYFKRVNDVIAGVVHYSSVNKNTGEKNAGVLPIDTFLLWNVVSTQKDFQNAFLRQVGEFIQ